MEKITLAILAFGAVCMIFLIAIISKRIEKNEAKEVQLDTDAQDGEFAKVTAQLEAATDLDQLENCFDPIKAFQHKYKKTISGTADTSLLIDLYLKKQDYFSAMVEQKEVWPDFVEN